MLRFYRKKLNIGTKEIDDFVGLKHTGSKYYIEKTFSKQKIFKYLLLLRMKGVDLNELFDTFLETKTVKVQERTLKNELPK